MAINKIMVLGAGTMGMGIAQVFAEAGKTVIVRDIAEAFIQRGEATLTKNMEKKVAKGKMTEEEKAQERREIARAEDLIKRMAAAAGSASRSIVAQPKDDAENESSESEKSAESKAEAAEDASKDERPASSLSNPDDILKRMAAMAGSASTTLIYGDADDSDDEGSDASDEEA